MSIEEETFVFHQEVLSDASINWSRMEKMQISSFVVSAKVKTPAILGAALKFLCLIPDPLQDSSVFII